MELLEGIETRRSTRGFKPTPVPRDTIGRILAAASRSPSYTNTQPWEVAIACGKKAQELRQRLVALVKAGTPGNPDIPSVANWPPALEERSKVHAARRFATLGIDRANEAQRKEMRLTNIGFYGAPCVIYLMMDKTLGLWSMFDMGLFTQSLALAAHSFGLGTCIQGVLTHYPDAVREILSIPAMKLLIVGVSLGYPDPEAKLNVYRSQRVGPEEFATWCE
jgi:nitroreductase